MEHETELTTMGEKIGWRTVRNTVSQRIAGCSLVHNLTPYRKLRRRTKALNVTLRRFSGIRSYSRYVKIRTSVLRNISDDNDTEDSGSFSEEDYANLHKLTDKERSNFQLDSETDFLHEEESDMDVSNLKQYETVRQNIAQKKTERVRQHTIRKKCETVRMKSETAKKKSESVKKEATKKKSVSKKSCISNVGWQNVVKRRIESTSYTLNNSRRNGAARTASDLAEELLPNTAKTIMQHKSNSEVNEIFFKQEAALSSEESLPVSESRNAENQNSADEKPLPTKLPMSIDKIKKENKESMRDDKEKCSSKKKQLNNSSRNEDPKVEGVKKNLAKIFAEQLEDEHELLNSLNKSENNLEKMCTEKEKSPISPVKVSTADFSSPSWRSQSVQRETIQGTNHPKDSGIDEDSQEELSEDGKHSENKGDLLKNMKNSEHTADKETVEDEYVRAQELTTDVTENQDEINQEEISQNLCSENQVEELRNLSQKIDSSEDRDDPQDATIQNEQDDESVLNLSNISILHDSSFLKEDTQRPKLHPKVTHTEVVNQKIKIIPGKYQNNVNSTEIWNELNKSNIHHSCQKSVAEKIDDIESVSGNETTDRNFTFQLDSSETQNEAEDSASDKMQDVIGGSSTIDKNFIPANSTEIQTQDEATSNNESESSEDISPIKKISTARLGKDEKEGSDESTIIAKSFNRANSTEIQIQDGADFVNEFKKSKSTFHINNKHTSRAGKKERKRRGESSIIAKNCVLGNSTEIETQDGTDSEYELEKSEDTSHGNKTKSIRARKKEKERKGRSKKSTKAENAIAVVDVAEMKESDSEAKDSSDIEFTNVRKKKKGSCSVKDVTQDSVDFVKLNSTEDLLSQESVDIQDEENSDSLAKSKSRSSLKALNANHQVDFVNLEDSVLDECDESAEDSMSALSKKRLQQLKRLNLIVGSESSSSEDERAIGSIRHPRSKFKKERKSLENLLDGSEEKETKPKGSRATTSVAPVDPYLSDSNEQENELYSTESSSKNMQNVRDRLSDSANNNVNSEKKATEDTVTVKPIKKKKRNPSLGNWAISKIGDTFPTAPSTSTPKSVKHKRPKNLQDLIEEESLIEEVIDAGISYKDLAEDDVYIIDVPRAALETDLLGKRIVLNEKKLKLGKQKYKVSYKNVNAISCCFATGKSHKPYKIANLKPVAAILAQAKISPSVASTSTVNQKRQGASKVNCQSVMKLSSNKRRRKSEDNIPKDNAVKRKTKRLKLHRNDEDDRT